MAAECIPTKQRTKPWVLWETLAVRKSVKTLKLLPYTTGGTQPLPMLRKLRRHEIN